MIYSSNYNKIFNNTLSQNAVAMTVNWGGITIRDNSNYNEVYNNTSYQSNIYLEKTSNNTIIDNSFESGSYGIYLYPSANNNYAIRMARINDNDQKVILLVKKKQEDPRVKDN